MEDTRLYILEYDLEIPFSDPRDSVEDFDDSDWVDRKGVVDKDTLGTYISQYLDALYTIFHGVMVWTKGRKETAKKKAREIEAILNKSLSNYNNRRSLITLASGLRKIGISAGESVELELDEAKLSKIQRFYKIAQVTGTAIGLAAAFTAIAGQFENLRKSFNLTKNNKATAFRRAIIFEGTISPMARKIMSDILNRRLTRFSDLRKRVYDIQDAVAANNRPLANNLSFNPRKASTY